MESTSTNKIMMKRKYRVILLAALVLGWMGVIFMFSSQDGAASSETSGRVVERVIAVVKPDFNSLAKSEQIRFREMVTFFVRKGAHFTEYMILGVLLFLFYYEWRPKIFQVPQKENMHIMKLRLRHIWFIAWITGTLYAASDEFHQMFTGERSPQVRDVCIDSSGAAVGCLLALVAMVLIVRKFARKMQRQTEK
ncbi:VanZ family protein [Firmicutes bacterium AF25-13AC]|nr:VanZ family protein [Clostridiales bacterium]RHQ58219.1 VanZ family protein [Firmicutes bacterium AF25-13AC]